VALGVVREGALELISEAQVVHDEPARLVVEDAVHARDGLHQSMAPHRLVGVHGVQAGSVEPRQPHVADDDDLERVLRVLEPHCELLAARLVADVLLPRHRVGRAAGHHDLQRALRVVLVVPLGPQLAGWSDNVVPMLKQNPEKSIILMDGFDLRTVLDGHAPLEALLEAKLDALNLRAEPFYSVQDYLADHAR
jgi:hypothetical protein